MLHNTPSKKELVSFKVVLVTALLLLTAVLLPFLFEKEKKDGGIILQKACRTHTKILQNHYNTLLLPGYGDNTSRQQLNTNLQTSLTENIIDKERLTIAETSLPHLQELQKQINNITKENNLLNTSTKELENFSKVFHVQKNNLSLIEGVIEKTNLYMEQSLDIQEILSLMNTQSTEIFTRIIKEDGVLSEEHIIKLNEDIPLAEHNFDSLTALYREISSLQENIHFSCSTFITNTTQD